MRHSQRASPRQHSGGFGLVEVIMAASILMIIGAAITSLMKKQGDTITTFRGINTRDALAQRIVAAGSNPKALQLSRDLESNRAFKGCTKRPGCPNAKIGFSLVDSFGTQLAGTESTSSPVRYKLDGGKCTQPSPQCPLEAFTSAKIACKAVPGTDCIPTTLQVSYIIRQAKGVSLPGAAALKTITGDAPEVRISDLDSPNGPGAIQCTRPGEVLRGITADGKPDCVNTTLALGYEVVEGLADRRQNPNAAAGTVNCGWPHTPRMQHVVGTVCCPARKIPTGGGGECNSGYGGFMETAKTVQGRCWFVDCCKYDPYGPSKIWVQCINDPQSR